MWDRYVDTLDAVLHNQLQHCPVRSDDGSMKTWTTSQGYWLGLERVTGHVVALTPQGGRLVDVWHPDADHIVQYLRCKGWPVDGAR